MTDEGTTSITGTIPYSKLGKEEYEAECNEQIYARFAPYVESPNKITIPKKARYAIERHLSKKDKKEINKDTKVVDEMCYLFLSNFSNTIYRDDKWKALNSTILKGQTKWKSDNTWNYTKIIDILKKGTKKKGPFIEVKVNKDGVETYQTGTSSKEYKLTDTYLNAGLEEYELKDVNLISNRKKYINSKAVAFYNNFICQNLFHVYQQIELPTEEQVLKVGRELAKNHKETKKRKIITMRNKHGNSHWKDYKNRSFVEDNIKRYLNLTKNGPRIFSIGNDKSGGRVVDILTLTSSWVRNLIKINGEPICEVDYSTLHPNIAMKIYSGSGKNINHDEVAAYLGIDRKIAKTEHLSFFNKSWNQMRKSDLFKYYMDKEPEMMENIKNDKFSYPMKYNITSRRLFKVEVEIMTKAIKELNEMNIYVIYVYDALYCEPKYKNTVVTAMNKVVKEMGINTYVKA